MVFARHRDSAAFALHNHVSFNTIVAATSQGDFRIGVIDHVVTHNVFGGLDGNKLSICLAMVCHIVFKKIEAKASEFVAVAQAEPVHIR